MFPPSPAFYPQNSRILALLTHYLRQRQNALFLYLLPALWITLITPQLYYLTSIRTRFSRSRPIDDPPIFFHAVFARFGPCLLYTLIVDNYVVLSCHRICTNAINLKLLSLLRSPKHVIIHKRTYLTFGRYRGCAKEYFIFGLIRHEERRRV